MTSVRSLLTFNIDEAHYGIDATHVRESIWLPELTPVEEVPPYVVGMFSLRNQLVPVTDLNIRFGHHARSYRIDNQVIVLEQNNLLMGLIVSEVREVVEVTSDAIQPAPKFQAATDHFSSLILGEVQIDDYIVTLLDTNKLVCPEVILTEEDRADSAHQFCPEATPEQYAILHERAKTLMESVTEDEGNYLALAVVELDGEYFGIELESVQEFCEFTYLSPIPCCPPHILGVISLRGNLFTLLDVRSALNLPQATLVGNKAVVARIGEQMVGVSVDEVHDVVYLRQEAIQAAPAVLIEQNGSDIRGAVHFAGKTMVVLDLPALLAREEWIVNESI